MPQLIDRFFLWLGYVPAPSAAVAPAQDAPRLPDRRPGSDDILLIDVDRPNGRLLRADAARQAVSANFHPVQHTRFLSACLHLGMSEEVGLRAGVELLVEYVRIDLENGFVASIVPGKGARKLTFVNPKPPPRP